MTRKEILIVVVVLLFGGLLSLTPLNVWVQLGLFAAAVWVASLFWETAG